MSDDVCVHDRDKGYRQITRITEPFNDQRLGLVTMLDIRERRSGNLADGSVIASLFLSNDHHAILAGNRPKCRQSFPARP